MAEMDSGQERTERASPRRRQQAREKGQIPRSRELTTAAVLLAVAGGMLMLGGRMTDGMEDIFRHGLHLERAQIFQESGMLDALGGITFDAMSVIAPLLLFTMLVALLAPLGIGGWAFSPQAFAFNWSRLDPVIGMGRVFAWRGLAEMLKAFAKFALVAACASVMLWHFASSLLGLALEPLSQGLADAGRLLGWSFLGLSAVTILIAAADVPFQLWDYSRQLRMTRQESRDELKETEGRPEVKGHIRRVQREMARGRMMVEVPKADVIITNPTHYAVALRYDQARMRAPLVVAKGADLLSAQIRRLGAEFRVPMVSAPALARALYYSTKLNHEVPAGLYLAVAKILAYVYQLRQGVWVGGRAPQPPTADDLPIPPEMRRD